MCKLVNEQVILAHRRLRLMGTVIDVKIWHTAPEAVLDDVERLLHLYKDRFSANDTHSDLMRINHHAGQHPVTVSSDLFELITIGKAHSMAEKSCLNIAIGPLVKAWRIGFRDANVPSAEHIAERLRLTDPTHIVLNEAQHQVFLQREGMEIDLGALAKGYIADCIVQQLKAQGVQAGFINLGGNILTFGRAPHHADGRWRIGIQHPERERGEHLAVLQLEAASVVTSGIYERTFEYNGQTYHHLFDRYSGYPMASDIASLTIVSERSLDGEIWTTRLFGQPLRQIFREVEKQPHIEAVIVTHSNEVIVTSGLLDKWIDNAINEC